MNKLPVWLDCDIGVDDAVALMVLHALPELELLGISAVSGNAPLADTYRNAHRMNGLMKTNYPVYKGAEKPLLREARHAPEVHGRDGLGGAALPEPPHENRPEAAWDALYACAKARPGELNLIATGPLTNVATAFAKYPDLPGLLRQILLMGGAAKGGNVTPAAEFNVWEDPDAAKLVFAAGAPIGMCGLDVTEKAILRPGDWEELAASGKPAGLFVRESLQTAWAAAKQWGEEGVAMHDACPVLYLAHPELFKAKKAGVRVETRAALTLGKTVTDLWSDQKFESQNALVVLDVDRDAFIKILKNCILRI